MDIGIGIAEAFVLAGGAIGFGSMLLVKGGDWTVDAAVYVAKRFNVSQLIIGFTILAFGTSLPEFIVSVLSNLRGSAGIAVGNVVGSNIANIALIIGLVSCLVPLAKRSAAVMRDMVFMVCVSAVFAGLLLRGFIGTVEGLLMLSALVGYVSYQYIRARHSKDSTGFDDSEDQDDEAGFSSMGRALLFLFLGLVAIACGAEFLVRGARIGAEAAGVPEAVIALSLVAFGTSLPELSTSLVAARKGHSDMLFGNIIGSNVFNILLIMGSVSVIKPISATMFAEQIVQFDIWVMLGVSAVFAALLLWRKKIDRVAGAAMFVGYLLYNIYIYAIYVAA